MESQSSTDGGQPVQGSSKKNWKAIARDKRFIVGAIIGVLLVGSAIATFVLRGQNNHSAYDQSKLTSEQQTYLNQDDPFAQQYLQGCKKDRQVSFTHSPVPMEQLGFIEPMGKMTDGHVTPTDHMYVAPKNQTAADNTSDVVMPADGTVTTVGTMPAEYIGDRNQQTAPEDHRLVVTHNCQYVSIFIHVHQLSDALKAALGSKLQPNEQKQISVDLKAGDKLGKIGGNPVDWSLMDATKTLSGFITPDLYKGEPWKIHVIDPIAVYTGSVKDQMVVKSLRSTEPYGGKIDYDKKGALVGNWFREGTNGYMGTDQSRYWDGHLSVVPNYIDPDSTVVSLGNWQGKASQFAVKGSVDPATVTKASGPVKYELTEQSYLTPSGQDWTGREFSKGVKTHPSTQVKGTVIFQVMDGENLKVERFPGKTAAQVSGFTSAAQVYVR